MGGVGLNRVWCGRGSGGGIGSRGAPPQIRQLIFTSTNQKNKLTDLWGNRLLHNDFNNNLCETIMYTGHGWRGTESVSCVGQGREEASARVGLLIARGEEVQLHPT